MKLPPEWHFQDATPTPIHFTHTAGYQLTTRYTATITERINDNSNTQTPIGLTASITFTTNFPGRTQTHTTVATIRAKFSPGPVAPASQARHTIEGRPNHNAILTKHSNTISAPFTNTIPTQFIRVPYSITEITITLGVNGNMVPRSPTIVTTIGF